MENMIERIEELEEEVQRLKLYINEINSMMMTLHDVINTTTMPPWEFDGCALYWLMKQNGDK